MNATQASDSLRADHRKIEGRLDPLLEALLHLTPAAVDDVRRHFQEIQRLAAPHFKREEEVFYPEIRDKNPSLLARMDEQHADTRQIEAFLEELLASLPPAPGERDLKELQRLGIEFHDAVQTHILDEEDHLLAFADRVFSAEEQGRLLVRMEEAVEGNLPMWWPRTSARNGGIQLTTEEERNGPCTKSGSPNAGAAMILENSIVHDTHALRDTELLLMIAKDVKDARTHPDGPGPPPPSPRSVGPRALAHRGPCPFPPAGGFSKPGFVHP